MHRSALTYEMPGMTDSTQQDAISCWMAAMAESAVQHITFTCSAALLLATGMANGSFH